MPGLKTLLIRTNVCQPVSTWLIHTTLVCRQHPKSRWTHFSSHRSNLLKPPLTLNLNIHSQAIILEFWPHLMLRPLSSLRNCSRTNSYQPLTINSPHSLAQITLQPWIRWCIQKGRACIRFPSRYQKETQPIRTVSNRQLNLFSLFKSLIAHFKRTLTLLTVNTRLWKT